MKRTQRNTKQLENIAEICCQILSHKDLETFAKTNHMEDSTDQRFFAIDAALIFDRMEAAFLKAGENDWNYEWYDAIENYVSGIFAENKTGQKELETLAWNSVQTAGMQ